MGREYEQQVTVKLNDFRISRLDMLAKLGSMNRHYLMQSFVNLWLNVLGSFKMPHVFYLAIVFRDLEAPLKGIDRPQQDFSESTLPARSLPIKLTESAIFSIDCFANKSNITRHQMMKNMVITGIDELAEITDYKLFDFAMIEPQLNKAFVLIMRKALKAFEAGMKVK
ncbi:MAG: hypothetical protein WA140_00800 [Geobacteraceae bacterium]